MMSDRSAPIARPYDLPELMPGEFFVEPDDPLQLGTPVFAVETSDPFDLFSYRIKTMQHAGRTAVQDVVICDTYNYGRTLFLDGFIQSAEDDEVLYHELLVQPPLLWHPDPREVLIIGGGEGACLREVLAHRSVRRATMVDIDPELVELCRQHMQDWHRGAFDDPRARLVFADGRDHVVASDDRYDVIIIDVVDMLDNGPAQRLYTRQFYEMLRERLRPEGIVVLQALEFSFQDYKEHAALARTLRTVFSEVHSYRATIPSFLGSWGFLIASDWLRPQDWTANAIDQRIVQRLGHDWLDHLNGAFLLACFAHCKETQAVLAYPGPILEDGVDFLPPPDVDEIEPPQAKLPVLDDIV
jgi:spermidine synthase